MHFAGRIEQKSRLGFAASAAIGVDMRTNSYTIDCELRHQLGVHGIKHLDALLAGGDIRLVGDHNIKKSRLAELNQRFGNPGQDFKFCKPDWGIWLAVPYDTTVYDAITVQKYCPM